MMRPTSNSYGFTSILAIFLRPRRRGTSINWINLWTTSARRRGNERKGGKRISHPFYLCPKACEPGPTRVKRRCLRWDRLQPAFGCLPPCLAIEGLSHCLPSPSDTRHILDTTSPLLAVGLGSHWTAKGDRGKVEGIQRRVSQAPLNPKGGS